MNPAYIARKLLSSEALTVRTGRPRGILRLPAVALQLRIGMLLLRQAEAEIGDEPPRRGTARISVTLHGSRIDTQPRPMPRARAASHRHCTAPTTE